ncbi:hypothetical protein PSV08DRAFT_384388 [Bipolaris maydis]|uniref:uncharacterized protein n=1 Tax=Cochliobolus heterostrophus TaxID=5016 RepID=UPI0024CFAD4B|nr:hypothetical protein PSV08DRAFT_384388 [Bipolaris maydis]
MFRFTSLVPNPFLSRSTPPPQSSDPPSPPLPLMAEDAPSSAPAFPFLRLPLELREQIYSYYFHPGDHLVRSTALEAKGFFGGVYHWDFDVFYVNKQIHRESKRVWRRENIFVKIATPWPSAGMYRVYILATEGVPEQLHRYGGISLSGSHHAQANAFSGHHAVVQIDSPMQIVTPEHMVVMLADDLPLFTRTWYYSALSYPTLNERLNTTFMLRNPAKTDDNRDEDSEEQDQEQDGLGVPLAIQRKLLHPFEHVKGLHDSIFIGFSNTVQSELARLQARPIPSLEQSLESATDYLAAGDAALAKSTEPTALEAIELYKKAFHAIHILVHGRTRRVMADVFFQDAVTNGRYAGQTGVTVRVVLRLKLVSRFLAAYNQLARWDDAAFWGMRSVTILEESLNPDFEMFLAEVLGGSDVGMIYLRTGIAFWHMECKREDWMGELISYADDDLAGSRRLWDAAVRFLRHANKDEARSELLAYGVPRETVALFADVQAAKEDLESMVARDGSSTSEE